MIGKVTRGKRTRGLLAYLLGSGRSNEHQNPRVIATWASMDGTDWARASTAATVTGLAALMDQPLAAVQHPPPQPVWHCSLRAAPEDPSLSDEQWASVALDVLHRTGLALRGDDDGCRWMAVRHAEDHIHLVVSLARQDGRAARVSNDYYRVGEACQAAETRYGLRPTPSRDRTAPRRPTRAETERRARGGTGDSPRSRLHLQVRAAAAQVDNTPAFLDLLRKQGVLARVRYSERNPGEVTGYAVAWPGDYARPGQPMWLSGGKLAADLTLPKLRARWGEPPTPPPEGMGRSTSHHVGRDHAPDRGADSPVQRAAAWSAAGRAVSAAFEVLAPPSSASTLELLDITRAVADLTLLIATVLEGSRGGAITAAARLATRGGAVPYARVKPCTAYGDDIRAAAQAIAAAGPSAILEPPGPITLLGHMAGLFHSLAAAQRTHGHADEATAISDAAVIMDTVARTSGEGRMPPWIAPTWEPPHVAAARSGHHLRYRALRR